MLLPTSGGEERGAVRRKECYDGTMCFVLLVRVS